MRLKEQPTFSVFADAVTPAQNKHHISILNASDSTSVIRLRKLHVTNLQLSAVTGVGLRFDIRRISGLSSGTSVVPRAMDSALVRYLPTGLLVKTAGTCVDVALLRAFSINNDEVPLTLSQFEFQFRNLLPEGPGVQAYTLRAGEGLTVQQITNSVVGSLGWYLAFSVESKPQ